MSDMQQRTSATPSRAATRPRGEAAPPETAWTGWVMFGAMMMVLLGAFQAIAGLVALLDKSYYAVGSNGLLVQVSYTTWGWVHLVAGLVAVAAGFGLFTGAMWARVTGVVVAMVSAVLNLAFLSAAPIWCTMMIIFDVVVIYAITAHGAEMKSVQALRNS